jgi:UDP-glucose 4-epimerase
VANVVEANLLAADRPAASGQVLNIAAGQRYTLLELIDVLNELLGTDIAPVHGPPRPGDVRHSLADISAAGETLGYSPRISFRQGLQRTLDRHRV